MKQGIRYTKEPEYSRKRRAGKCVIANCQNYSAKDRLICHKHRRQKQKIENPLRYWFDVFRQNARNRKIDFQITIEQFREFCEKTRYLELKGKGANNLSIDRIKNNVGYIISNIRVLTLAQNSRKRWIDEKIQFGGYLTPEEREEFYKGLTDSEIYPAPKKELKTDEADEMPF